MASLLVPDPGLQLRESPMPGNPAAKRLAGLTHALDAAVLACDSAIAYHVQQAGPAHHSSALAATLVDAVEVGQTGLDLARRGSPLLPLALDLCAAAFERARAACRGRHEPCFGACAGVLDTALAVLVPMALSVPAARTDRD